MNQAIQCYTANWYRLETQENTEMNKKKKIQQRPTQPQLPSMFLLLSNLGPPV